MALGIRLCVCTMCGVHIGWIRWRVGVRCEPTEKYATRCCLLMVSATCTAKKNVLLNYDIVILIIS